MVKAIDIGGRSIGSESPCFIIAEAGVNHNGDMGIARRLVDAAVEAGADAVKFQTFKAERLVTLEAPMALYQKENTGGSGSQYEMLKRLELPEHYYGELQEYCKERDILFLSTPFDEKSADFLDRFNLPLFKISSGEITNLPFLSHVAGKGKPVILSTGMANLQEVEDAVACVRAAGNEDVILLQCTSNYPASPSDVNLRTMLTMADEFSLPVGFSDHTTGIEVSLAAAALGAVVIEKHFTLDKNLPGPDHRASLDPVELKSLVQGIRKVEEALGDGRKEAAASEAETASVARKSLVAARRIPAGTILSAEMVAILRPGTGISPAKRNEVVGRKLKQDIEVGTLFTWEMLL